VRTEIDLKGNPMSASRLLVLVLAVLALCGVAAGAAQAAPLPAPGLKVLAATGPTHLPPRQSEVQRLTVEAEGGTFKIGGKAGEGKLTPVYRFGVISVEEGSNVGTVGEGTEALEVGDRVISGIFPREQETFITSCSSDCTTPGSTVTFSAPVSETLAEEFFVFEVKEATVEEGTFPVGSEVVGSAAAIFLPGTEVTAVSGSQISLSKPAAEACLLCEGAPVSIIETTAPLAYDATPETVQSALASTPAFGAGAVTVSGGPGGDAAHPYFFTFGGKFAEQDVEEIHLNASGLVGAHKFTKVLTVVPGGNGTGEIAVSPANVGALPTTGALTIKVGPLPTGIVTSGPGKGQQWTCPGGAGESTVTCTSTEPLPALHASHHGLSIPIEVQSTQPMSTTIPVELSGGGGPTASTYPMSVVVSSEPASFGIAAAWAGSFEADGSLSTQAGSHPFDSAAFFMVNSVRLKNGALTAAGDSKNIVVDLPPGFVGNPLAGPRCPQSQVVAPQIGESPLCNDEQTVGNLDPLLENLTETLVSASRLYNDKPPLGTAAEFSTILAVPFQSVLANVNSEGDFGIKLTAPNNPNYDKIFGAFTAFEGVPVHGNGRALLTNPTNCAESRQTSPLVTTKANTFQDINSEPGFEIPQPALTGCELLHFTGVTPQNPGGQVAFSFTPTNEAGNLVSTGSTPVGAEAHLHIASPGLTDPNGLATPELKRSVIKLPEGMSLNPSSANGLEGCSEAQIGYKGSGFPMPNPMRFNEAQPACPGGSQLGTAEIRTPLLDNPLVGTVYLANQDENPYGSLLAIYLVVNDPLTGVLIKLPGEVRADPQTGRLTTTFDNNPQLPFEDLILRFRGGGARSEFATSEVCGNFPTEGEWTPWSAPESGPAAQTSDSFNVSSDCAANPGARPFAPSFEAGTTGVSAGGYSPLVVNVSRKDGEQELTSLDFTLPKGLIGKLAGIPYCSEAQIGEAEHKSGRAEQANASCPAASQLGTVDTGAGVGPAPFYVGGKLYLAGPYKGAPVSAVAIVPAVAGPLDLGDVVVRTPLFVDHETAELTAKSDPLPTILKGIPLKIRSVAIKVDRSGFILNPTNCKPMSVSGSFGGGSGATANASTRFQAEGCKNLAFAPKLQIQLKGKTKRAGNPGLTAILTQPANQANIGFVSVALPHSEFLEQGHIKTICTRVQFAAEQCPQKAIYGHAEAFTPLLDARLTGPVYLRSSSNRLPDMVAVLKGPASQPIEVDLDGRIDSFKGGIRTTFETVPDAPVSKFILRLPAGKKSLIVNSTNICKGKHKATVEMIGQSGREHNFNPLVEPKCKKQKPAKKGKPGKKGAAKQKGTKK
jgi:hypothetical protein